MSESTFSKIDHIAIAVSDLDSAVSFYSETLGMSVVEKRETHGRKTGMLSVVLDAGSFTVVLIEGVGESSQVSRYIEKYGPGVQHVAFAVSEIEQVVEKLSEKKVKFSTDLLVGSGLKQIFTTRDSESGMMYEFIERDGEFGFQDQNVDRLFQQLEDSDSY